MKIIETEAHLRKYIELGSSVSFELYQPSLRTVERRYLVPVIGREQYQALQEALDGDGELDEDILALYDLCQEAVANLGMAVAIDRLAVNLDDAGLTRSESGTRKSAYQYQEMELKESYIRAGYDTLDEILVLMESDPEAFQPWADSDTYKQFKKFFIQTGAQFNTAYNIRNSYYTFLIIRPIMKRVEDFEVLPVLGSKLFKKLKDGLLEDTLSEPYKAIIDDYIRPAIALYTISRALIERSVDVSDFGVSVNLIKDNSNSNQKQPAPDARIDKAAQQLKSDAAMYLSRLATLLTSNPEAYPDYEPEPAESATFRITNKQENSYVAV